MWCKLEIRRRRPHRKTRENKQIKAGKIKNVQRRKTDTDTNRQTGSRTSRHGRREKSAGKVSSREYGNESCVSTLLQQSFANRHRFQFRMIDVSLFFILPVFFMYIIAFPVANLTAYEQNKRLMFFFTPCKQLYWMLRNQCIFYIWKNQNWNAQKAIICFPLSRFKHATFPSIFNLWCNSVLSLWSIISR